MAPFSREILLKFRKIDSDKIAQLYSLALTWVLQFQNMPQAASTLRIVTMRVITAEPSLFLSFDSHRRRGIICKNLTALLKTYDEFMRKPL